jgi:pimeloyl-ACP methyl ester carboxylesterase
MTLTVTLPQIGGVPLTLDDQGTGRPILLLHGGGGLRTVIDFARLMADDTGFRVLTPTHPGFEGTDRPDKLETVRGLAVLYAGLLETLDLRDVIVVGNSIGGWIAAEMAVLDLSRVTSFVLVDAVGIEVEGHPVVDIFSLPLTEIADYSYYEPDKFRIDPAVLPLPLQKAMAANRVALQTYAGREMTDSTLSGRLAGVRSPTLVVWGESDRIADPEFGKAFASAIPDARFELLSRTGHMPQLETPEELMSVIRSFATKPGSQA